MGVIFSSNAVCEGVFDDSVSIRGTLTNRDLVNQPKVGFYYDIDILFDYLTLDLPAQKQTAKNLNGRIRLVNISRPQLYLDTVFGNYGDLPLQASGSIFFDTRQYDIQLKSKHSVDHEYFVNYFNISTIPGALVITLILFQL